MVSLLEKSLEFSVNDDRKRVAQTDQLLIIMENRIRIGEGGLGIDLFIVRVYVDPRGTVCKACIFGIVPLHRSTGIITADFFEITHHILCFYQSVVHILMEGIDTLNVTVVPPACQSKRLS